jgi:hypothetical protein
VGGISNAMLTGVANPTIHSSMNDYMKEKKIVLMLKESATMVRAHKMKEIHYFSYRN